MKRAKLLKSQTVAVPALDQADRDAMWRVFNVYYADVSRETFEGDLAKKNDVILLRDKHDDTIQGFSTLQQLERSIDGRRVVSIFSGDTIVDRDYWGQRALHWAFTRYLFRVKLQNPLSSVYWFLISKGYKTYLLLSRNFPEHFPRHDRPTPAWQQTLLDSLSQEMFGDDYKPALGLLQFEQCPGRLKNWVAPLNPDMVDAPDVRFFLKTNPHHMRGDELCCLGKVDLKFMFYGPLRLLRKAVREIAKYVGLAPQRTPRPATGRAAAQLEALPTRRS